MFSPDDFAHLKIPLENIRSATDNFGNGRVQREDLYSIKYIGLLSQSGKLIYIYAKRFKKEHEDRNELFWTEVSMLSSLKHKNLVSIFGFCDEDDEKIIIYKLPSWGISLSKCLSNPMSLTWVRRLEISLGLAKVLSYIYYDEQRDFSVIHRNISSYTVWIKNLDWEPILVDWELSLKIKASERDHSFHTHHTVSSVWDREGYADPTYLETHTVSHKSDIYSFGIVLFELLCGRTSMIDEQDNKYLAPMAIFHYREKTLDDIIHPDLWKEMDLQAFNVFAKTAYDCLNEERSQRPTIDEIVARLESALKLQMDHEHSIVAAEVEDTSSNHDKGSLTSISTHIESHVSNKTKSFLKDLSHLKLSREYVLKSFNDSAVVNRFYKNDEIKWFWTEVSMLSSLKHKNLVSLIGFYDFKDTKIIIYKKEATKSLAKYLSDQTLTWLQRLKICVGVAKALSYIHYDAGRDFSVIHCNITSSNILLDDKWEPKLSGFELSLKNTVARRQHLLLTRDIVENVYLDPKYKKTGGVTHKSDVYSFGVVLLEVLCRRSAGKDEDELEEGLLSQLEKSHLDDMVDPHLRKQMDPESFRIFSDTTHYCLQEERLKRPYIDQVVKRLDKALELQWKHENPELPKNAVDGTSSNHLEWKNLQHLKIGLNDIELATENFSDRYCIGEGGYGMVYKAQLEHFDSSKSSSVDGENKCDLPKKRSTVAIKRIFNTQGEQGFIAEIETLTSCKHDNIITLLGFCDEGRDHMILVYELASKGSLEDYLGNSDKMTNLTWMQRLKICVDIAHGLNYIHTNTDQDKQKIIHRDIKSANILLGDNWEAKIADFGLSKFHPANQEASTINTNMIAGTNTYLDPEYQKYGRLNKKSDIYSFGVVLLEILTGSLAYDSVYTKVNEKGIAPIARDHFKKGTLMEIVDRKIKEETDEHVFSLSKGPDKESLVIFSEIAFRCVAETQGQRPTIEVVINELKKALDCQEDYEIWKHKLPKDYKEIIQMSRCPEDYSTIKKKDLYNIFSKGILLQQDKVLLSFDGIGERNEMVSASMFSYKNSCPHEWKSLPESRFERVVEMFDISRLNIRIQTKAQFLSPNVVYGVYLVFKFCDSRNFSSKPMYVNLNYRKGSEIHHAYFATRRDKEWLMIELCQILNQNKDVVIEFLLKSFSPYHCGDGSIYVQGIEFRATDKVYEEIGNLKELEQVLKSNFNVDCVQQLPTNFEEIFKIKRNYDELFWLGKVNQKKLLMLSAKAALYEASNVNLFTSKPSLQTRFPDVIELLPQQVFHINCTIKSQMLSSNTEYVCYLVFKLSEKVQGLHCPVKVRDLLHQENNEAEFVYFITPSPLNINDNTRVPLQRENGWMEIEVWKFNSTQEFKDDSFSIDMKFTSHEGSMSGLIVCGLEFRPM